MSQYGKSVEHSGAIGKRFAASLVWIRRDLRLHDHAALAQALQQNGGIQPVFVFDTDILAQFPDAGDRRLTFIADALVELETQLAARGGGLLVLHGSARAIIPKLSGIAGCERVIAAEDYEPGTRARDDAVQAALPEKRFLHVKDHLIFAPREILREGRQPYKIFTPYYNAWRARFDSAAYAPYSCSDNGRYADCEALRVACRDAGLHVLEPQRGVRAMLEAIGYRESRLAMWPVSGARARLEDFVANKASAYPVQRDMMAYDGTSKLSPYLRFGLVSVRECARAAHEAGAAEKWISELAWRDFYAMNLFYYPESATQEWNPQFRGTLRWSHDALLLEAWKQGRTGFPLVDAAQRQLLQEGWMHNRARMVTASFLTKDLLLDWRLGEAHFAQHLMDYDMASNVGGWQWAASTGTDAQPWFRIFNPVLQSKKFDAGGDYIRRYVPELAALDAKAIHEPTAQAIVNHDQARKAALAMFKQAGGQAT